MVLYEAFLLPIMTGRFPMGHWGIRCLNLSMTNAMPSFIRLSRMGGWRAISTIMPIWNQEKKAAIFFSTHHNQNTLFPLTDNRWSMRRWQWWQWLPRGACKRNTTWFQWQSSPSICGKPVRSHLGNPFNSRTTFFRLSMVWKYSTQNIIFTWTSKGNTRPNGLFLGSTNPRQFILTRSKSGNWSLPLTSPY